MVEIYLEKITKKWQNFVAVNDLDLRIRDREFFVLLGPSGCGKTTTLNIIAGLEQATSGNIYFDNQLVNSIPPEKRDVAMVFQSYALYPTMTGYANISFPLRIKKMDPKEIDSKVQQVANMLKITQLLSKKPHEMSGGERQRIALARAVIRQPKVFLLDEPLSNLDAKLRTLARAELIRLQKSLQITTVYVTHDQVEAMTMGDRIGIMNSGSLLQLGEPMEVFSKPRNVFVAGFIGTPPMNFFEGNLVSRDNKFFFESSDLSVEVGYSLAKVIQEKKGIVMGVRPQNLVLVHAQGRSLMGTFTARVYAIERLGTDILVNLEKDGNIFKMVAPSDEKASLDEKLVVQIKNLADVQYFDKETGNEIA